MAVHKKNRTAQYSKFLSEGNFAEKIRRTLGAMSTARGSQYFTAGDVSVEMIDRFHLNGIKPEEMRDLKERCGTNLYQMFKNGSRSQRAHRVTRSPGKITPMLSDGGRQAYGYHVGPIAEEGPNADTAKNESQAAQAAFDKQKNMKDSVLEWFRTIPLSQAADMLVEAQMIVQDRHFDIDVKKERHMAQLEKENRELERKLAMVHQTSRIDESND